MTRAFIMLTVAAGLSLSCAQTDAEQRAGTALVAQRHSPVITYDSLWMRGGDVDHVLRYPEFLAHDNGAVYVSDLAAQQVASFSVETGQVLWLSKRVQLENPQSIAGLPNGGVVAIDGIHLVLLDAQGNRRSLIPIPDADVARQVCALAGEKFVIAYNRKHFPLVILDGAGKVTRRFELPWLALREYDPIQTQISLAGDGGKLCMAALFFGEGFAAISADSIEYTARYVEPLALPGLKVRTTKIPDGTASETHLATRHPVIRDLTLAGSTVQILFQGPKLTAGTLIDEYDAHTGRYLRSLTLDKRFLAMQKAGRRMVGLTALHGYPALLAISERPTTGPAHGTPAR